MAETKGRKTGEHNPLIVKLTTDGAAMREQLDALEARILRLEAEVATLRKEAAATKKAEPRVPVPPATVPRASKRPAGMGPPPLPRLSGSMGAVPPGRKMSMSIDVSEIAELVESLPPPAPRSKK